MASEPAAWAFLGAGPWHIYLLVLPDICRAGERFCSLKQGICNPYDSQAVLSPNWLAGWGVVPSCLDAWILLLLSGELYGKPACLCLGAIIFFGKRRTSSFFGPEVTLEILSSSAVGRCPRGYWCWGLVVFAEVKVPVRPGRKCGLCTCTALCVAPGEGASLW